MLLLLPLPPFLLFRPRLLLPRSSLLFPWVRGRSFFLAASLAVLSPRFSLSLSLTALVTCLLPSTHPVAPSPRVVGLICETAVPGIHPRLGLSFIAASSLLFYVIIKGTPQRGRFGSSNSETEGSAKEPSSPRGKERDR